MPVDPKNLIRVQSQPKFIRNICILAHVDHGKTSLSDTLLASNGIITQALQGQIRYLDSRQDEQQRGITMEASAISLFFKMARPPMDEGGAPVIEEFLVNLIDSPGHIDFSSEVSTASRLCDGAIVLVDAVEGVSSQTVTVLKQVWDEHLKPVLAINKIDRLVTELQMTPQEAYVHLSKLIEQVNVVLGTFFSGTRMEQAYTADDASNTDVELTDDDIYFEPTKGNVIFCSAIDGWGFTVGQFAAIYEKKLGANREKLAKVLWGDYYFDTKTKRIFKGSVGKQKGLRTMFVQFILDNIWVVYNAVSNRDTEKIEKIASSLNIKLSERELKSKDIKTQLTGLFHQWIPVSRAVLMTVVNCLPSPAQAQKVRTLPMLERTPDFGLVNESAVTSMTACDTNGPVVAFISKVMQVPESDMPLDIVTDRISELRLKSERIRKDSQRLVSTRQEPPVHGESLEDFMESTEDEADIDADVIVGVCRVYSGTISVGMELDLLGPKYDPASDASAGDVTPSSDMFTGTARTSVTITGLFMIMGRDMIPLKVAYPGTIVGVRGLDGKIVKSGTLVSPMLNGPNLAATNSVAPPILRVAVEPVNPTKIPELERGLMLLNTSDPSVEITMSDSGEHILGTAGELHLERCVKDLREKFAKVDIHTSEPIISYQETWVKSSGWEPPAENPSQERGSASVTVAGTKLEVLITQLPKSVAQFLAQPVNEEAATQENAAILKEQMETLLAEAKSPQWRDIVSKIVCFGPRNSFANLLVDNTSDGAIGRRVFTASHRGPFDDSIISGFNNAMSKGPLVAEPVYGMVCFVQRLEKVDGDGVSTLASRRIISAARELMYDAMKQWSPRLMLATYLCEIQASTDVLGKVYGVVTRRHGKILTEDIKEGTPFFNVTASLPVVDSFGFSEEIRKRTSGAANPQLVFNGYTLFDLDPYWVPTTEEQLEHFGETSDKENVALSYVHTIRRQKGLKTTEKIIDNPEQQRNMKK